MSKNARKYKFESSSLCQLKASSGIIAFGRHEVTEDKDKQ